MTDAPTAPRPPVACLIGPTRYQDAYRQAEAGLTCLGYVVLTPGLLAGDPLLDSLAPDFLPTLTQQKVDLADQVVVVGGEALADADTQAAMQYAMQQGKTVGTWMTGIPDDHLDDEGDDLDPEVQADLRESAAQAERGERASLTDARALLTPPLEDTLRSVQGLLSHAARAACEATGQVDALLLSRSTRAKSVTVPKATLAGIREHLVVTSRTLLEQAVPLVTEVAELMSIDSEIGR